MLSKTPISASIVALSCSSAVEEVCMEILSGLKAGNYSQDEIFAVHLAVEEAFTNAIKHGNKMNPDKEIKIDYTISEDKVDISLTDGGEGFNPSVVPDPRCGKNIYKTSGRGLFLMRNYMDVVEFNERGNCVHMVKYRARNKDKN